MLPLFETTDSAEPSGIGRARVLVLTNENDTLFPLTEVMRSHGLSVELYDPTLQGLSPEFTATFDLVVVFAPNTDETFVERIRQAHPDIFLARLVQNHVSSASESWQIDDFDGQWSLSFPDELTGYQLAAIARYAQRVRTSNRPAKTVGSLTLDRRTRTALLNGQRLELTAYEFSLLSTLAENLGSVLSRQELLELAKGSAEDAFDRSIDVQVSRLRAKLGDNPRRPSLLKTVRGKGYVLVPGQLEPKH
jgi:DNA-binding winged helix-turn-helix (wHTH) protein